VEGEEGGVVVDENVEPNGGDEEKESGLDQRRKREGQERRKQKTISLLP
jgi:hypothetical protein